MKKECDVVCFYHIQKIVPKEIEEAALVWKLSVIQGPTKFWKYKTLTLAAVEAVCPLYLPFPFLIVHVSFRFTPYSRSWCTRLLLRMRRVIGRSPGRCFIGPCRRSSFLLKSPLDNFTDHIQVHRSGYI